MLSYFKTVIPFPSLSVHFLPSLYCQVSNKIIKMPQKCIKKYGSKKHFDILHQMLDRPIKKGDNTSTCGILTQKSCVFSQTFVKLSSLFNKSN